MILTLVMSLAAAPSAGLVKTTAMGVRVRVIETCQVSSASVHCRGASSTPPPRVHVAEGVRVVEF